MDLEQAIQKLVAVSETTADAARAAEAAARDAQTAANGAKAAANATTKAIDRLSFGQKVLRRHVDTLWAAVIGGTPSMPPEGVDPATVPIEAWSSPPLVTALDESSNEAKTEIDEIRGQLLAVHAELREQSKAMGIGKHGVAFFFSQAGQREIVRTVGAVGALVAAIGAVAASCHSSTPAPAAPSSSAPVVYVIPAASSVDGGHL